MICTGTDCDTCQVVKYVGEQHMSSYKGISIQQNGPLLLQGPHRQVRKQMGLKYFCLLCNVKRKYPGQCGIPWGEGCKNNQPIKFIDREVQGLILKTPGLLQGKATIHLLYYHIDLLVHH